MINRKVKHVWFFLMFLICCAAMSAVTMLLWNVLIPAIFGGIAINFWQALGLLVLSRILFGGFGFHHFGRFRGHHGHMHGHPHMHGMSRKERKEYIMRHMQEHGFCGCNNPENEPADNE